MDADRPKILGGLVMADPIGEICKMENLMNELTNNSMDALAEFSQRLLNDWLPTYCNDPKRNYSIEGFKPDTKKIAMEDARDFLRALDNEIVSDIGGGRFRMPQSKAFEVIFWEGLKKISPRPITLWHEPIITIAAIARLHFDFGWPVDCLGMQSEDGAFDLMAFMPQNLRNEHIAGEVKKSSKELDNLLLDMNKSCIEVDLDYSSASPKRINAHNKLLGLRRCRAPLFWALGPGGDSRLFEVSYSSEGDISLNRTSDDRLHFTNDNQSKFFDLNASNHHISQPSAAKEKKLHIESSDVSHTSSKNLICKPDGARLFFRAPIPEIADAARYLDAAVSAHQAGRSGLAEELIRLADNPTIREWTESILGKKSPYVQYRATSDTPQEISKEHRVKERMPTTSEKNRLLQRDGYHCRFCGIPVIRREVRELIRKIYPDALQWGSQNINQHAAFQAMWVQYDHILPHARGGNNDLDNMVITCAACNYGRMQYTLDEVGLVDPRTREPIRTTWDGLERLTIATDHVV